MPPLTRTKNPEGNNSSSSSSPSGDVDVTIRSNTPFKTDVGGETDQTSGLLETLLNNQDAAMKPIVTVLKNLSRDSQLLHKSHNNASSQILGITGSVEDIRGQFRNLNDQVNGVASKLEQLTDLIINRQDIIMPPILEDRSQRTEPTKFDRTSDAEIRDSQQVNQQILPTVINQINPPTFDGDRSKARSWLKDYTIKMDINSYSDAQKLTRARAYMIGDASNWINSIIRLYPDLDWLSFKERFLRQFCGADGQAEIARRLDTIRQGHEEHPSYFLWRVIDLCFELNPKMSESEMIKRVSRGLKDDISNQLYASRDDPSTWTIDWLTNVFSRYKMTRNKSNQEAYSKGKSTTTAHKKSSPIKNLSNWICANCNEKGHLIEQCSQPKDEARIESNKQAIREKKRQEKENNLTRSNLRTTRSLERSRLKPTNHLPCDDFPKPKLTVLINNLEVQGRVDSGADMTVISEKLARKLELKPLPWDQPPLQAANKINLEVLGTCPVLVQYNHLRRPLLVAVLPNDTEPLWGNDFLHTFDLMDKFKTHQSHVEVNGKQNIESDNCSLEINPATTTRPINMISQEKDSHPIDQIILGNVSHQSKKLVTQTLLQYRDIFSRDDYDIGRTSTVKHRIHLTDDIPIKLRAYKTPIRNKLSMEQAIDRMITTGAIRTSSSPYASPVFFVDKDQGKGKRLVADFRALNKKTIPDRTPMPHPEDVYGYLKGMKVFCKLDITSMFNQIEVDERDIEKTAIITPLGLYECPLMPFGLMNAPATAVKLMEVVLKDFNRHTCYVYFDDIIIFAEDINQLMQRCIDIFERLRKHNLKLKPSKCSFAVESVKFLGHIISAKGIEIDPTRFEKVKSFPIPRNSTDVRSFHGLCSYNRKFIKDFATIAKPLTPLMGKNVKFIWTSDAQQAFEKLQEALITAPVLVHFDPNADHELRTDASQYAIGAILYQNHKDPKFQGVVLYYSKTLKTSQRAYSASERELLAAYSAITELQHYLFGKKFTLITDHQALSLLRNNKDPHHRMTRWVAQLQCYEFDVSYKRGIDHKDADCMSRLISDTPSHEAVEVDKKDAADIIRSICPVLSQQSDEALEEDLNVDLPQDIRIEQDEDEYCSKYIRILEDPTLSQEDKITRAKNFTLQNNTLHRIQGDDILLVVPTRRRGAILLSCHDVPLAGHLGFQRTYSIIRCRFYWPKMRNDIKKYVASCLHCQKRKFSNTKRLGLIKPLPIAEDTFDTLGLDLMTKLPKSESGYSAIFVCVDHLSKYVIAVPIKDESTESVLFAFYSQVIAKHGCPKLVVTDRAISLIGERSRDFFKLFGIKRKITAPYHPQSNGQTERYMRTIAASITAYIRKNQRNWSDYVAAIAFAYNITQHSVTGVSPYEIVFGKKPRLPIDNLMNRNEFINPINPSPDIRNSAAMQLVKDLIIETQEKNKDRLDKHLKPCNFKVGDQVLFARPTRVRGGSHKLCYVYVGPFKITRKCGESTFELSTRSVDRPQIAHSYNLRKYIPREEAITDDSVDIYFNPSEAPIEQPVDQPDLDTQSASESEEEIESPDFEPLTPPAQS